MREHQITQLLHGLPVLLRTIRHTLRIRTGTKLEHISIRISGALCAGSDIFLYLFSYFFDTVEERNVI